MDGPWHLVIRAMQLDADTVEALYQHMTAKREAANPKVP
jgi:hypothetical protein